MVVFERHHEILAGRSAEAVHEEEYAPGECIRRRRLCAALDSFGRQLLPRAPRAGLECVDQAFWCGTSSIASHIDDERGRGLVLPDEIERRLFERGISKRRDSEISDTARFDPSALRAIRRRRTFSGGLPVDDDGFSRLQAERYAFGKKQRIRKHMSAGHSIV